MLVFYFFFYHSPYDFNVTLDSLIKKIKTVETELFFDSGNFLSRDYNQNV